MKPIPVKYGKRMSFGSSCRSRWTLTAAWASGNGLRAPTGRARSSPSTNIINGSLRIAFPGLPEVAAAENLTPLAYMRKYGAFEVTRENYVPYEKPLPGITDEEARRLDSLVFRLTEVAKGLARDVLDIEPGEGLSIDSNYRIMQRRQSGRYYGRWPA